MHVVTDNEWAFFKVLSNTDLWREFRKYMFPGKKTSNFYNYRSGDIAAYHGYIGLIKESNQLNYSSLAMDNASEQGHLEVVKFLHYNRFEGCTKLAIDYAAQNGHLTIVMFLHQYRKEGCTNYAILWATNNGHMKIVEYLFIKMNRPLSAILMDKAAEEGYRDIVEFLYKYRGSYRFNKDRTMKIAKTNNRHQIIKFLEDN